MSENTNIDVIRKVKIKSQEEVTPEYPIGADAENITVTYSDGTSENVKAALENKAERSLYQDDKINIGHKKDKTQKSYTVAVGQEVTAAAVNSIAIGDNASVEGLDSSSFGKNTRAYGDYSHAEGNGTTASGHSSHAEGESSIASGNFSHSEGGIYTQVKKDDSGNYQSIREGCKATSYASHAEGMSTVASGYSAHAEGMPGRMSYWYSGSVEVIGTEAQGEASHAEGYGTKTLGYGSHAEGDCTQTGGRGSHAEGGFTYAAGSYSHAEGRGYTTLNEDGTYTVTKCVAYGQASHAGGYGSMAYGDYSFAHGQEAVAGKTNDIVLGSYPVSTSGTSVIFTVGCGTDKDNRADALRITKDIDGYNVSAPSGKFGGQFSGTLTGYFNGSSTANYVAAAITSNGKAVSQRFLTHYKAPAYDGDKLDERDTFYVKAEDGVVHSKSTTISGVDYAEYICPWWDNNINAEDRVGYFVSLSDGKLKFGDSNSTIIGITSETYGVLGTGQPWGQWHDKYVKDNLGRIKLDENRHPVISSEFDETKTYIDRENRPEWTPVGILGQLYVYDDGTCLPGQWCKCTDGGIATYTEQQGLNTWIVLERVSENTIKILFK